MKSTYLEFLSAGANSLTMLQLGFSFLINVVIQASTEVSPGYSAYKDANTVKHFSILHPILRFLD